MTDILSRERWVLSQFNPHFRIYEWKYGPFWKIFFFQDEQISPFKANSTFKEKS